MQRTIYIKNEAWESIKASAKKQGRSISNYIVNLHQHTGPGKAVNEKVVPIKKKETPKTDSFFRPMPKKG